jgi:hypothetical protein
MAGYRRVMGRHPGYPFDPRSTAHIRPGDFWAIPTRRGGWYCCGQVLGFPAYGDTRTIIVGLLDWCEPDLPTADSIAGVRVLDYGDAHVKTVRETGGMLLGHGTPPVVPGLDNPNLSVWGYQVIEEVAHEHFGRHFPEEPHPAIDRPTGFNA